jgi:enoyl-CoA hydratase
MSEPLRIERPVAGVVVLTLSVPARRNAMTAELTAAWAAAIPAIAADPTVRAVVVTGEGTVFCAGGDLSWLEIGGNASPDELRARMYPFYTTWLTIRDVPVPTIAAVNGPAIGAGLCLALACDLRYAAPGARFSAPFTSLGMHPGMAATYLLPEVVGLARAREMFFTGRSVDAAEAASIGLVNRVVPADDLLGATVGAAERIAATAPIATKLTKAALRDGRHDLRQALEWEALAQPVTMASEDMLEGIRAQVERRRPVFSGR